MDACDSIEESDSFTCYSFPDTPLPSPSPFSSDYVSSFHNTNTPIVIDNGSYHCRVGWAGEENPRLCFENVVSKYRDRKQNTQVILVGNDTFQDITARSCIKNTFDAGIPCNPELQEYVLDHAFYKLGLNEESVSHPICMTEPVCMPSYCRKLMSELLFECYKVPKVCYGIDSLFSYYQNTGNFEAGFVISSGHHATTIIPVWGGRGIVELAKRIPFGGLQSSEFMLRLMQLKYPSFPVKMTLEQAQYLVRKHTFVAEDYAKVLQEMETFDGIKRHNLVMKFPYVKPIVNELTEEEKNRLTERKREHIKKMQETATKKRLEKLIEKEQQLQELQDIKELKKSRSLAAFIEGLELHDLENETQLNTEIKRLEASIKRSRSKDVGIEDIEEKVEQNFSLVDIPDEELDEEQRKEKKKQKLLKAGYDARQRIKKAKEEEQRLKEEERRKNEELRLNEPAKWLNMLREQHKLLVEKIKNRRRRKVQLNDRRSVASQMRMKSIANLVADTPAPTRRKRKQSYDDDFGADDEDWTVYREISKDDDDTEAEEEDESTLIQYEELLLKHDEAFHPDDVLDVEKTSENSVFFRFLHGASKYDAEDLEHQHRLHVNVERIRVPEVLLQPTMVGLDYSGVVETILEILKHFSNDQQRLMIQNIVLTGSHIMFSQLDQRIYLELRKCLPEEWHIQVKFAKDCSLDAWKGGSQYVEQYSEGCFMSREEYFENGMDYLKEHAAGNTNQSNGIL